MKQILLFLLIVLFSSCSKESDVLAEPTSRTLIVYYSYTGNVQAIVDESLKLTEADVVEIQPAEEGLKYEADNYALGSALIGAIRANPDDAGSYPEIKPVDIDFSQYDNIIVATPLWWSNMAAPMQTFLFHNGGKMAGKNIALIVSSASSGISSVVDDAHRLIPDGNFSDEALWINNSNRNNMPSLLGNWIKTLNFSGTMAQKLFITVGNATITATMVDNVATQALIAALKESPISYEASDYGDFEKVGPLGRSLPTANEQTTTQAGDIVLYNGNQIVIFYGSNSWSYTRIGKIDDISQEKLKSVLGDGNCTITLSLSKDFSTGVQKVHGDADNPMKSSRSPMYDLQGHEITAPTNGQVYIQDGRKWLIQE
jgi:flavodoxin